MTIKNLEINTVFSLLSRADCQSLMCVVGHELNSLNILSSHLKDFNKLYTEKASPDTELGKAYFNQLKRIRNAVRATRNDLRKLSAIQHKLRKLSKIQE